MWKSVVITLAAVAMSGGLSLAQTPRVPPRVPGCLHGRSESTTDRMRRIDAEAYVDAIIAAERRAKGPSPAGKYRPLENLNGLPPMPAAGFAVKLLTDGTSYMASAVDTKDPCRFAIFADESANAYEGTPRPASGGIQLLSRR